MPSSVSFATVQSFARFMFGEPVSRGPIWSVNPEASSITFELRKPSWRMRVWIARSGWSAVSVVARRRVMSAFMRAELYSSSSAQSTAVGTFDFAKIVFSISSGV